MSDFKNFENEAQRQKFFRLLWQFGRDFLFVGLTILAGLWQLGILEKSNDHLACNAEQTVRQDKADFFYQDGNYFSTGNRQSSDVAFEGKYSLKLDGEVPFGFDMDYEYLRGDENVVAWVWRFAEGDWKSNGRIIAVIDGKLWKASDEVVETKDNGWEKIQFTFDVPNFSQNEILNIYCWNSGRKPIYFDDLHIVLQRKELL
ncbi:MAG: hypothetical protein AAF573_08790 [Bacteroidota bacterium]